MSQSPSPESQAVPASPFTPDPRAVSDFQARFAARPASTAWEPISLPDLPQCHVWAWFKPPALPPGLFVQIPEETFDKLPERNGLTIRKLLSALGIDPGSIAIWYLYGAPQEGRSGTSPAFDEPIPKPTGADPNIAIVIGGLLTAPPGGDVAQIFENIDSDWNTSLRIEKQLLLVRKQLAAVLGRLGALDRDLSPDERLHGDRQDKSDWQEVRRLLKDARTHISRYIKEHDTGETSTAGKRHWLEQTYQQCVVPRQPIEGMERLQRDFESQRKRLQTLLGSMSMLLTGSAQEAERRAQQVLGRLAARVRTAFRTPRSK